VYRFGYHPGVPWPAGESQLDPKHTVLIVRWYEKLGSTRAVAKHLRCSRTTVIKHLRLAGVEMRRPGRPTG
jgi:DNA invertase Pin-like site-specific DNA recombinase